MLNLQRSQNILESEEEEPDVDCSGDEATQTTLIKLQSDLPRFTRKELTLFRGIMFRNSAL